MQYHIGIMPIEIVSDINDPRIASYRHLKDRELARDGDLFIAEGEHIVRRLIQSGACAIQSLLVSQTRWPLLEPMVPLNLMVYLVGDRVIDQIIGYKFHLGMLAVAHRPAGPSLEQLALGLNVSSSLPRTLVICPDIINHENLGSLLRISAGLGADGMLLGENSCNPYWRRSVRVSMGAIFRLPLRRSPHLRTDLDRLRHEYGFTFLAAVLDEKSVPLRQVTRPIVASATVTQEQRPVSSCTAWSSLPMPSGSPLDRVAVLVGNEAQGLPPWLIRLADVKVTIPMHHHTDSLNVSVATAIILHHLIPPSSQAGFAEV